MNKQELTDRLLEFAARNIRLGCALPRSEIGRHVGMQLMRAATSAGANYCEACGAESRQDFVHKMQISLKELRESQYWLRLIARAAFMKESRLQAVLAEANELISIFVAAVSTAKRAGNGKSQFSNQ